MKWASERGLTLIELMVALAVAAVVLVMVQGVFLNAGTLRETSRSESVRYHRSRVFFDRLSRELGSTLYRKGHPYAKFVLRGGSDKQLEFATFASSPDVTGRSSGAVMVVYQWQAEADGAGYALLRRERPLQAGTEQAEEQLLADRLNEIELRCYDGERWLKEWDSQESSRLPKLLEVSFVAADGTSETPFRTVMEISSGSGG